MPSVPIGYYGSGCDVHVFSGATISHDGACTECALDLYCPRRSLLKRLNGK